MKTTTRLLSIITLMAFLASCAPAPTPAPTIATSFPTEAPTEKPILLPTPTQEFAAVPVPYTSSVYPDFIPSQKIMSPEAIEKAKQDFLLLKSANPYVASEAEKIQTNLLLLAKKEKLVEPIITGYLINQRWVMSIQTKGGGNYIVVDKNSGLSIADVGAYQELVSPKFSTVNYSLRNIIRPLGTPQDSIFTPVEIDGWVVYAYVGKDGHIISWYDTTENKFKTQQGDIIKNTDRFDNTYKPFSELTKPEECVQQRMPNINNPNFPDAFEAYLQTIRPKKDPGQYDYMGLNMFTTMMVSNDQKVFPATFNTGWRTSSLEANGNMKDPTAKEILGCATMENGLQLMSFYARVVPDANVSEFGTAYVILTVAVDPKLLKKNYNTNPRIVDVPSLQPFSAQFSRMKQYSSVTFILFTGGDSPIRTATLSDPLLGNIAQIIQKNQQNGVEGAIKRMLTYSMTKEDLMVIQNSILPANYCIAQGK